MNPLNIDQPVPQPPEEPPYPAPKGKIWKTDGNCEFVLVDHPDTYADGGRVKLRRRQPTNITPKKKKRRK